MTAQVLPPSVAREIAADARRLRRDVTRGYTEVDLLVAAMREHIQDLRNERDRLLAELERLRETERRQSATWLARGQRPQRRD